jgi:hypothetical protein
MLRCINAREAALVDPAAGLHVRFRLGGSSFPPLVFYKIFTHRPVTGGLHRQAVNRHSQNSSAKSCVSSPRTGQSHVGVGCNGIYAMACMGSMMTVKGGLHMQAVSRHSQNSAAAAEV